jgi:hypothetical protein
LKLVSTLEDFDRPKLARPIVDVLEEMTVNGAQMDQIERTGRDAQPASLNCKATLDLIQLF